MANTIGSAFSVLHTGRPLSIGQDNGSKVNGQFGREGDTVTISKEAVEKYNQNSNDITQDLNHIEKISIKFDGAVRPDAEKEAAPVAYSWQMYSGLESGEKLLENGNKMIVSIKDDELKILEYDNDKLVKSVEGELTADGAILSTKIFDDAGEVSQIINTQLTNLGSSGKATKAKVTQSVEWYDRGELQRKMTTGMTLQSEYRKTNDDAPSSLPKIFTLGTENSTYDPQEFAGKMSKDFHASTFTATVEEYTNGRISQKSVVEKDSKFTQLTNRTGRTVGNQKSGTTIPLASEHSFVVRTQAFDTEGNMLRESLFSEDKSDGTGDKDGTVNQSLAVSWFNDGELVKRSSGKFSMKETPQMGLQKGASLLDTLGIEKENYATKETKSAAELLATPLMESSSTGGFYGQSVHDRINSHEYDSVDTISKFRELKRPYNVSWENEIYKDGELAARQFDEEGAQENVLQKGLTFRTAGALSEDRTAPTLYSTKHVDESYEKGRMVKQASLESRETVHVVEDGPDKVHSQTKATRGVGFNKESYNQYYQDELINHDNQANAASTAMAKELDLTLTDAREMLKSEKDDYSIPEFEKYNVFLNVPNGAGQVD